MCVCVCVCAVRASGPMRIEGGGGGCCLAEEGEEPYMKWCGGGGGGGGGGGMGLQPHPPVSAHGVLYSPTIMYVTDL